MRNAGSALRVMSDGSEIGSNTEPPHPRREAELVEERHVLVLDDHRDELRILDHVSQLVGHIAPVDVHWDHAAFPAAEQGFEVLGARDPFRREIGVELEGMPAQRDLDGRFAGAELGERLLELAFADIAPGTDDVGDDIDREPGGGDRVHGETIALLPRQYRPVANDIWKMAPIAGTALAARPRSRRRRGRRSRRRGRCRPCSARAARRRGRTARADRHG